MGSKLSIDELNKVAGGQGDKSGPFQCYSPQQVAMLAAGDKVSVLRYGAIYQCHVYMPSMDDGLTIDVRGGGLPDDLKAASYTEVGPAGQN